MPVEHSLPFHQNLLVTTPNTIYLFSRAGKRVLFECESAHGIVSARAAPDNSSLLAVASRQIVLLHDTKQPREEKHKLEGEDDTPRVLLFSPDSRMLFFNATIDSSIHAYSLPTGDLLPSALMHPSSPKVLATSSDGNLLLSASASPPTVLIQDLRLGGFAAVQFKPTESTTAVTCAAFEMSGSVSSSADANLLLGFRDGTLALFRVCLPVLTQASGLAADFTRASRLQIDTVGVIGGLHKASMGGVTATAFHVDGPATSLSVTKARMYGTNFTYEDMFTQEQTSETAQTLIAVGTQIGKILIFNMLGLLVHEVVIDVAMISVEWVGDMSAPPVLPTRGSSSPGPNPVIDELIGGVGDIESPTLKRRMEEGYVSEQTSKERPMSTFIASSPVGGGVESSTPSASSSAAFPDAALSHKLEPVPGGMATPPFIRTPPRKHADMTVENRDTVSPPAQKLSTTKSHRVRRACSSGLSCCMSPRVRSSEQDFFTAPPTRHSSKREGKDGMKVERIVGDDARSSLDGRKDRSRRVVSPFPDSSSSLYSRPKSRISHGCVGALDGGADIMPPGAYKLCQSSRRSFSFDAGLDDFNFLSEPRYATAKGYVPWSAIPREDLSRLLTDSEVLKRQMTSLRNEFRALKSVLLHCESQRRWQDCVS
ncbi:hypothetical protein E8E13_009686 [Curvularia kusanoi]|uniref:WD40 repeat-like protein n=1 Tax=Curvularia kusanoi TaxID=90978 RepID=A0A9P4THF8_CURKU|nr:hypothetical protein E8E13_009686 [Curvularia kusanoi]